MIKPIVFTAVLLYGSCYVSWDVDKLRPVYNECVCTEITDALTLSACFFPVKNAL